MGSLIFIVVMCVFLYLAKKDGYDQALTELKHGLERLKVEDLEKKMRKMENERNGKNGRNGY